MHEFSLRLPKIILNFFINILNERDVFTDGNGRHFMNEAKVSQINADDVLSIHKLQSFEHVFNRCPIMTAGTMSNSQNIKNALQLDDMNSVYGGLEDIRDSQYNQEASEVASVDMAPIAFENYTEEEKRHVQALFR